MANILHVGDNTSIGLFLADALARGGHSPVAATNVVEALQVLAREQIDLIISDDRIPELTGLEFLELLQQNGYDIPLITVTADASIRHVAEAIEAGATDYITAPIEPQRVELVVNRALELVRLRRENAALRREVMEFRNERQIVGESVAIRRILQTVAMAAPTGAPVLVRGESGTGKELFARAIHDQSDRWSRPFIKLNCAALPDGLIESAFLGQDREAFTGVAKPVEGAFEQANGGTLVLDEISEVTLELQAKLLRVLQEHKLERAGGNSAIRVDVRVIVTTSRDLAAQVATGTFLQDLYGLLNAMPIHIPPLRERVTDIPLLAYTFAKRAAADLGKEITGISPAALAVLTADPWPGNVRELQHAVERAVIVSREPVLEPHAFDVHHVGLVHPLARHAGAAEPGMRAGDGAHGSASGRVVPGPIVLTSLNIDDAERVLIQRALEAANNNRTRTAQLLGISVRTLRNKLNGPGRKAVA